MRNDQLVAAYYSVPQDRYFCVFEVEHGKFTAAELKNKKKWEPIKSNSKLLVNLTTNNNHVECELRMWLRKNAPAAQKLNYVKSSLPFPDCNKIKTVLKRITTQVF